MDLWSLNYLDQSLQVRRVAEEAGCGVARGYGTGQHSEGSVNMVRGYSDDCTVEEAL